MKNNFYKRMLLAASIAILMATGSGSQANAEATLVRGTRVTMETPPGFKAAANFCGYTKEADRSSIMVTEMPAPYEAATAGFNEAGLATRGMKLISKNNVTAGSYPGILVEAEQSAYGTTFRKWIMAFGDKSDTIVVTATYPADQVEKLSAALKEHVISARFNAAAKTPDPMEALPFTVSDSANLHLAGRLQNTLMFTATGKMPVRGTKDHTIFVIGQALTDIEVGDKAEFARERLKKTATVSDIQMLTDKGSTVGGMPAREITATAKGKDGESVFIYQNIAYGRGSYFILQGLCDAEMRAKKEPEFRQIVSTFKLK